MRLPILIAFLIIAAPACAGWVNEPVSADNLICENTRKQAEQGDAGAQSSLAFFYENGVCVTKDLVEAVNWYRKAAVQGLGEAQHNLGRLYYLGEGVPKNYPEASKWYRKAADQGLVESQGVLGLMYYVGEGVPQYYEEAYFWLNLAATAGDTKIISLRDEVERKLSPQQVSSIQKRAKEWKPTLEKGDIK